MILFATTSHVKPVIITSSLLSKSSATRCENNEDRALLYKNIFSHLKILFTSILNLRRDLLLSLKPMILNKQRINDTNESAIVKV